MQFARFALAQASGTILAHSITTPKGVLKKGRLIGAAEIAQLQAAGITEIVAARLEPGDVGEDAAAARVANAAAGAGIRAAQAFTGRANLFATQGGVLVLDHALIDAINAIDERITLATLPEMRVVVDGEDPTGITRATGWTKGDGFAVYA